MTKKWTKVEDYVDPEIADERDPRDCMFPDCLMRVVRVCAHSCPFEQDKRRENPQ